MAAISPEGHLGSSGDFVSEKGAWRTQFEMCIKLSKQITSSMVEWNVFIHRMRNHLGPAPLNNCKDIFDIVYALETEGLISLGNYKILSKAFKDIQHTVCKTIVDNYTKEIREKMDAENQAILNRRPQDTPDHAFEMKRLVERIEYLERKYGDVTGHLHGREEQTDQTRVKTLQQNPKDDTSVDGRKDMIENKNKFVSEIKDEIELKIKPLRERIEYIQGKYEDFEKNKKEEFKKQIMSEIEDSLKSRKSIAFSAYAGKDLKNLKLHETIIFDAAILNIGSSYNTDSGIFECPEGGGGLYFITATIFCFPNDEIETEIVRNGNSIPVKLYAGAHPYRHDQGTNSVVVELNEGDEIYVRVNYIYPKQKNDGVHLRNMWSSFSAFRID